MPNRFSGVWLLTVPWTVALQAPLSMGLNPILLCLLPWQAGSLPRAPAGKPRNHWRLPLRCLVWFDHRELDLWVWVCVLRAERWASYWAECGDTKEADWFKVRRSCCVTLEDLRDKSVWWESHPNEQPLSQEGWAWSNMGPPHSREEHGAHQCDQRKERGRRKNSPFCLFYLSE